MTLNDSQNLDTIRVREYSGRQISRLREYKHAEYRPTRGFRSSGPVKNTRNACKVVSV